MTKTKQVGTLMSSCHPIVEALVADVTNPEMLPLAFATSVLRGLRRTLEEVSGAVDNVEAGATVEEECALQNSARGSGQTACDEATGLPLDLKLVADAVNEELMSMRKLQVYHEVLVKPLGKAWFGSHRNSMDLHEQSGRCESICERTTSGARNQESERVDTGRREQHLFGHAATGVSQVHAQSMHDWQPTGTR